MGRLSSELYERYKEAVFQKSANVQVRRGDPVRLIDWAAVAEQRELMGLTDEQIAEQLGLETDVVTAIRTQVEKERYRFDVHQTIYQLKGGRKDRRALSEPLPEPASSAHVSNAFQPVSPAATQPPQPLFHWTSPGMVPRREGWYPAEESDRTRPYSERAWSAVESLPLGRLRDIQLAKLQHVVRFAWDRSPFYRQLWERHGVSPADVRHLDDIRRFPLVRKEDFEASQLAKPIFGDIATSQPDSGAFMKFWSTSGSTGRPRLWLETKEDHENDMLIFIRAFYAYGVRSGMRGYFAFAYPPFEAFWKAHYAAEAMGCHVIPKGPLPTAAMLRSLTQWKADFMVSTPTFAIRQAEVAQEHDIDLCSIGIKTIVLAGEPGATIPGTKQLIEQQWGGARVCDAMGMTEIGGPVLFTCAEQADRAEPSEHMLADYALFEVLDADSGQPAAVGQDGALVATSLFRLGMPVIRMYTNDIVELSDESCGCGRTFPLVKGGVKGRLDDVIFYKGVKVVPATAEVAIRAVAGLGAEYLFEHRGDLLRLSVEALPGPNESEFELLAQAVQAEFTRLTSLRIPVQVVAFGSLPRSESKSKRVVRT